MSHHKYSSHHVKPRSRGGKVTVELPKEFHEAWHIITGNLTPEEIELFIKDILILMRQKDKITFKEINKTRENIKKLFNEQKKD